MIMDLVTVTSVMASSSVTVDSDCNSPSVNNVLNQPVSDSDRTAMKRSAELQRISMGS